MNIEGMSRDEPVFAEGSPRDSRRRARGIDMGDEYLRRSIFAYVDRNPLIVVFHFTDRGRLPKLSDKELREIRAKFLDVLKEYPDVTFYGTWVDDDGMGICLWEAPNEDVAKEIVERVLGSPPADSVISVKKVL